MKRAWFKIDVDLLQDPEIEELIEKNGHEVITAILAINSYLRIRKLHKCDVSKISKIARRSDLKEDIVYAAVHYSGLYVVNQDCFYSEQISEDMNTHDGNVKKGKDGARKRWDK